MPPTSTLRIVPSADNDSNPCNYTHPGHRPSSMGGRRPGRARRIANVFPAVVMLVLLAPYLSGCATSGAKEAVPADLHAQLQTLAQQHHVCAVAIAVVRDGKLDTIDAASACPAAPPAVSGHIFQAASLSKPVFAYAVLKLVAAGRMELDAPVLRYLPQGYRHRYKPGQAEPSDLVTDQRLQAVTVRMLLNHTSGLTGWASGPLVFDTDPGSAWAYSGEGYVLLQRAVEALTGQPVERVIAEQVLMPLGMQDSTFRWNEGIAARLLPGTKANGAIRSTAPFVEAVSAYSLYTTAADYGSFFAAILNDKIALRQITERPALVDRAQGLGWGLGWGIERQADRDYLWQWGSNPGYRAFVIASPETGDGFVMLTNSENGMALAQPLTRTVLGGEYPLFASPVLGVDVLNLLCTRVRLCF